MPHLQPSPPEWRENAGCTGKVAHPTAAGAYIARRRTLKRDKAVHEKGRVLVVYRCRFCTQWHVGNQWK